MCFFIIYILKFYQTKNQINTKICFIYRKILTFFKVMCYNAIELGKNE